MIKAVLFDFDGVIVNSEPLHKKTFLELLAPYGVKISDEAWYREFAGTGSRSIFARLLKEHKIKGDPDELVAKRKILFHQGVDQGLVDKVPGVEKLLEKAMAMGIKMAIVSGGHRGYIDKILKMYRLGGYFQAIITAESLPERKPNPAPFLAAARLLNVRPEECLVIEDSYSGCSAGKKAGMTVIWLRPDPSMPEAECDYVISDLREADMEKINDQAAS